MEKNQNVLKNWLKKMLTLVCMGLVLVLLSCNNNGGKTESRLSDTTIVNNADEDVEALAINDATYYLKLKANDLQTIFSYGNGNQVKQLFFQWKVYKKNYSLEVYGIDSIGNETQHFPLEIITSKNPVKNIKHLTRNPQLIIRGDLKKFLGLPIGTNTTIEAGQFKDMFFVASLDQDPRHPGKNLMYLFYSDDLTKLDAIPIIGSGSTNPSPPARPCTTGCDY